MTWSHVLSIIGHSIGVLIFLLVQSLAVLMVPFDLPGLWVQFAACVILTLTTGLFGWWGCALIFLVACTGQGLAWIIESLGLTSVSASRLSSWGAVLCGFTGAFLGFLVPLPFPLASMVMSFAGTFLGAIGGEIIAQRRLHPHLHVAMGAVLGRACGISAKLSLAFISALLSTLVLALELVMHLRA